MISKNFKLVCLLVALGVAAIGVAYALVYETGTINVTQTIRRAWHDLNWLYRQQVTVNYTRVSANFATFQP